MNVISFVNQKGGTGKSLLAINLAVAAEASGEKVCLIDLDPQGTIANWDQSRVAEQPAVLNHEQASQLKETLKKLSSAGFTLAVIDTKGEDSHATRGAMEEADLCLIPVRPAGPDLHATRPTIAALKAMGREFALVLNQAPANKQARLTATIMTKLSHDGPVMPLAVAARMDNQYAYALGQGAQEYAPDGKAAEEMAELWACCRKRLTKQGERTHDQKKQRA